MKSNLTTAYKEGDIALQRVSGSSKILAQMVTQQDIQATKLVLIWVEFSQEESFANR